MFSDHRSAPNITTIRNRILCFSEDFLNALLTMDCSEESVALRSIRVKLELLEKMSSILHLLRNHTLEESEKENYSLKEKNKSFEDQIKGIKERLSQVLSPASHKYGFSEHDDE